MEIWTKRNDNTQREKKKRVRRAITTMEWKKNKSQLRKCDVKTRSYWKFDTRVRVCVVICCANTVEQCTPTRRLIISCVSLLCRSNKTYRALFAIAVDCECNMKRVKKNHPTFEKTWMDSAVYWVTVQTTNLMIPVFCPVFFFSWSYKPVYRSR